MAFFVASTRYDRPAGNLSPACELKQLGLIAGSESAEHLRVREEVSVDAPHGFRRSRKHACNPVFPGDRLPVKERSISSRLSARAWRGFPRESRRSPNSRVESKHMSDGSRVSVVLVRELASQVPYAYAAVVEPGNVLVFTAGACPLNTAGEMVFSGEGAEHARQVMENLETALRAAGAELRDVAKTTVYVASDRRQDLAAGRSSAHDLQAHHCRPVAGGREGPAPGLLTEVIGRAADPLRPRGREASGGWPCRHRAGSRKRSSRPVRRRGP
jgi:enamine deaminase RidA (YjgF/YER057c/UK114 family)